MNRFAYGLTLWILHGCTSPVQRGPTTTFTTVETELFQTCEQGNERSCDAIAEQWTSFEIALSSRQAQAQRALTALQTGCRLRVSSGCVGAALMIHYGLAGVRDRSLEQEYWRQTRAFADLQGFRGEAISSEGQQALAQAQAQCSAGRARACNQLGWAAYSGVQRSVNLQEALEFYRSGCNAGSLHGCRWAGHFARTHPELGQESSAEAWLTRACTPISPGGCAELGRLLRDRERLSEAMTTFRQACDHGSRLGCYELAVSLQQQSDADATNIRQLLERACQAGESDACQH